MRRHHVTAAAGHQSTAKDFTDMCQNISKLEVYMASSVRFYPSNRASPRPAENFIQMATPNDCRFLSVSRAMT